MKKGQEPGQLDKEAVGRITCRILQEEEPGSMLVKKLWRLAGMLICLLCLTGGLCSAFLSGFGIRYFVPGFWVLLVVSVLFWIGFSRLSLEGVYRLLAILGTLIGVSLFLLLLQKEQEAAKKKELAGSVTASWGDQIRSYFLYGQQLVKDLRTGFESTQPDAVFDGEIDGFIAAGIRWRSLTKND